MSSVKDQLLDNFKSGKEYRHAFVEEKVRTQLALQIKALREQRAMGRPEFAALMKKAPSWVFRLEDPNQPPPTISTLLQVAEAFDVDLDISFGRFSGLLDRIERMMPESFEVPSFEQEAGEGAFDGSSSAEEAMGELRESGASGGSSTLPPGTHESGARRSSPVEPHAAGDGRKMKAKHAPRAKRLARRSA